MRRIGQALLWIGAGLGAAVGVGVLTGTHPAAWSWLMTVGLAKLAVASSLSLMSGGAVCLRLDRRQRERNLIATTTKSTPAIGE